MSLATDKGEKQPEAPYRVIALIPARLESTRLPRKPLLELGGQPLLKHVWERTMRMERADHVAIATDSEEILEQAAGWGATVYMTRPDCASGTERIASLLDRLKGDFFLNVQGDEPFIEAGLLDSMVQVWDNTRCDVVTPVHRITAHTAIADPNLVKVVRGADGRALYFSRSPIPYVRGMPLEQWPQHCAFWAHIGVYGYTREILGRYTRMPAVDIEQAECLEQLRFLHQGYRVQTLETTYHPLGVDTAGDLEQARRRIAQGKG